MPRKVCGVQFEVLFPYQSMVESINPVADVSLAKNGVFPPRSFDGSVIQKIWKIDPEIAKKYVYIDDAVLENNYPGVKGSGGKLNPPFDKLPPFKEMPGSKWKSTEEAIDTIGMKGQLRREKKAAHAEILLHKNGGWVINEGSRLLSKSGAASGKFCSTGSGATPEKIKVCHAISGLGNLQNGKGYHFRVMSKQMRPTGGGFATFSIDDDAIEKRIGLLTSTMPPYSVYAMMMPHVTYWVKTAREERIQNALRDLDAEFKLVAETGTGKFIKAPGDLDRWISNILNNGMGTGEIAAAIPFHPDKDLMDDPGAGFIKDDFLPAGRSFASECSQIGTPVLVDHDNNFVAYAGKKRPSIASIVGNTSMQDLKKWEWRCASVTAPFGNTAIVPRTIVHRRSVDAGVHGGKVIIQRPEIDREMKDVMTVSWNAMVKSRMREGLPESKVKGLARDIIADADRVSNPIAKDPVITAYVTGSKKPVFIEAKDTIIDGPYLIPRKFDKDDGIPKLSELGRMIHDGDIVMGIENDVTSISKDC